MSDVLRIGAIIIFQSEQAMKAKFLILCNVIYWWRLQEKFQLDHFCFDCGGSPENSFSCCGSCRKHFWISVSNSFRRSPNEFNGEPEALIGIDGLHGCPCCRGDEPDDQ